MVGRIRAVVTPVAERITIDVGLIAVGNKEAIVAGIANAVPIMVGLIRIRVERANVACVAQTIVVTVRLIYIGNGGTIVLIVKRPVAIGVAGTSSAS